MMKKGNPLPDISLRDQNNHLVNLRELVGDRALVVYFYPKDDTPGCTAEACSFRDHTADFAAAGARVVGISSDTVDSHRHFTEKHNLNFTLLADPEKQAENAFKVPRNLLGLLPGRVTYIFGKDGQLIRHFNSAFMARKHVQEALKALKEGIR